MSDQPTALTNEVRREGVLADAPTTASTGDAPTPAASRQVVTLDQVESAAESIYESEKRAAPPLALVRTAQRGVYLTPNRGLLVRRADDERRAWWVVIDLAQDRQVVADGRLLADVRGEAARLDRLSL